MHNELESAIDPAALAAFADQEEAYRATQEQPGLVVTREVDGRIIPIHPEACPHQAGFAEVGQDPVCCNAESCCGDLFGFAKGNNVLCDALRAPRHDNQPIAARIALQLGEKLPLPPLLN